MKKVCLFLFSLSLAVISEAQLTQTVSSTLNDLSSHNGPSDLVLSVPKFNSSLGLLTGVNIAITISNNGKNDNIQAENKGTSGRIRVRKTLTYDMDIQATTSGTINQNQPGLVVHTIDQTFPAYDGVLDYAGTSGLTEADPALNAVTNYAGDIALFNGSAGQSIDVLSIAAFDIFFTIGGGGNADVKISTLYDIILTVTYTYSSTLPLTLVSFTGEKISGNKVGVNWKTSYEENIDYFDLEYSLNGQGFEKVVSIKANNNTAGSVYNYTHSLANVNAGVLFYRLKYVETDGRVQYSNIIRLGLDERNAAAYKLYPNPASSGQINISGKTAAGIYSIYTSGGAMVMSKRLTVEGTVLSINIQQLQKGHYFVRTPDGDFVKFIVL